MGSHNTTATHSSGCELYTYIQELAIAEALPTILPAVGNSKWRQLAMVKTIGHSGMEAKACDVTHLPSPFQWREFLRGFKDAGTMDLGLWFGDKRDPTAAGTRLGWPFLFDEFFRVPANHVRWWDIRIVDDDGTGIHRLAC